MKAIHFYSHRRVYYAISIGIILVGIIVGLVAGVKLDIEFKGGSIVTYSYKGKVDLNKAEKIAEKALKTIVTCQNTESTVDHTTKLVISASGSEALTPEQMTALTSALQKEYPEAKIELSNSQLVAPYIGRELLNNGIKAILIASVLIVIYVWISFRSMSGPSAGVMALIALFHDIIMAFVTFIIMRIPINETLVAVVLTILGFSINDTIVIYDRIRENIATTKGKMPLDEVVDLSITQSLARTINTSICTFGAVLVAYIFAVIYGIESIREFALPMMIGIIFGNYSSNCLAGPLWVAWKTRKGKNGYE